MDNREFDERTEAIVRALLPRIPDKYASGFEGTLAGGELEVALEDLVYTVVDDQVVVSEWERDVLVELARNSSSGDELLEKLRSLAIGD
ncbi:hypothetical protein [Natronoglycomyces albus]|uniref:Uncharacterized protein n=1 Tax=Natronoglycomyces albus TaxID=2811108 RepID=A0A895XFZ3_9ACTN|nr:hypothetical protein [Natronoglycomyces albus]QSB04781.1 hypothetical protein JQS30_13565 [Natronoglycomyces albus]